jgi:uncharacterized protein YigA (DUF484 family)
MGGRTALCEPAETKDNPPMIPHDPSAQHAITEDDIADFLANTPDFFERHAELLATVQLSSGHGSRAVSLQERQAGMLRDKIKGLESRVVEMIRHGQENVAIADKMQRWTRQLLLTQQASELPAVAVAELKSQFLVPQVALKVWGVSAEFAGHDFAMGVSDDVQTFASSLGEPYCGVNSGFEAMGWLPDPASVTSVALVPLRVGLAPQAFGLLVLASADPDRFQPGMGTDFLTRIGELASAALTRLRDPR